MLLDKFAEQNRRGGDLRTRTEDSLNPVSFNPISALFDDLMLRTHYPFQSILNDRLSEMSGNIKVNMSEYDDRYEVEALVPGFKKEDIHVDFKDNNLTIKASHSETRGSNNAGQEEKEIESKEQPKTETREFDKPKSSDSELQERKQSGIKPYSGDNKDWDIQEFRSEELARSLYFENVDIENINAQFDNGVLNITLPKYQKEEAASSSIPIK